MTRTRFEITPQTTLGQLGVILRERFPITINLKVTMKPGGGLTGWAVGIIDSGIGYVGAGTSLAEAIKAALDEVVGLETD